VAAKLEPQQAGGQRREHARSARSAALSAFNASSEAREGRLATLELSHIRVTASVREGDNTKVGDRTAYAFRALPSNLHNVTIYAHIHL
jgi:hypothetical protein